MTTEEIAPMHSPIDRKVEDINRRLRMLTPKAIAVFSACTVERNVDIYSSFAQKENTEYPELVRDALDETWEFLSGSGGSSKLPMFVASVKKATPHLHDYSSIEAILAQNVCISVDSMLRWCLGESHEPLAGEFVLEALRAVATHAETGFYELGSGSKANDFEHALLRHPVIENEFNNQVNDLKTLESQELTNELILKLKRDAKKCRFNTNHLLGQNR